MPTQSCSLDGKPGRQWGKFGTCFTYDPDEEGSREAAEAKANQQGRGKSRRRREQFRIRKAL